MASDHGGGVLFNAVSTSARQLFSLLRCIAFAGKATVRITADGLRFSAEESSVMEAYIFLPKFLFRTYTYNDPNASLSQTDPEDPNNLPPPPTFQISHNALLETLQIFSISDPSYQSKSSDRGNDSFAAHRLNRHSTNNGPFSATVLGTSGLCRLTYAAPGSPLSVHMAEAGVSTTCELTTYEASTSSASGGADDTEIPFDRNAVVLKAIMRSSHLADAVNEIASTNPDTLVLSATPRPPRLSLSGTGALGSTTVEFGGGGSGGASQLLETFQCQHRCETRYAFGLVKAAYRAMGSANKVSVRVDQQGVLSLQFLIEVEPGANGPQAGGESGDRVAFIDFRIVPNVEDSVDERDEEAFAGEESDSG